MDPSGAEPQVDEFTDDEFAYEEVIIESDEEGQAGDDLELALRTVKSIMPAARSSAASDAGDAAVRANPAPGEAARRPEARPSPATA